MAECIFSHGVCTGNGGETDEVKQGGSKSNAEIRTCGKRWRNNPLATYSLQCWYKVIAALGDLEYHLQDMRLTVAKRASIRTPGVIV